MNDNNKPDFVVSTFGVLIMVVAVVYFSIDNLFEEALLIALTGI